MVICLGERFYVTSEFLESVKGLSQKMFEYLRDTLKLIPSPIKMSEGKGIVALYHESSVRFLKRVLKEKRSGVTYKEIKHKFRDELVQIFSEGEFLRRQFEILKPYITTHSHGLMARNQPDIFIKNKHNAIKIEIGGRGVAENIVELKRELKGDMKKWDGKSISYLSKLRYKIDELEKAVAIDRARKTLSWGISD